MQRVSVVKHSCYLVAHRCAIVLTLLAPAFAAATAVMARDQRLDGFNVIAAPESLFGTVSAQQSLRAAKRLGAKAVAVIPFLWQSAPASSELARGDDMPDDVLRMAIRQAHGLRFSVIVKPHVWVSKSWAGAVDPGSAEPWILWFANYRREIERIARIAAEENADVLVIGTELTKTVHRPEWRALIVSLRGIFPRTLVYVAHNADEAEVVPFWDLLDMIGVSLYPPFGKDHDRAGRLATMRDSISRLEMISAQTGKPLLIGEVGLRSAKGAAAKPWESAEERMAPVDLLLQAEVLADWLAALDRPAVRGVLVWRWFTDPNAGGSQDTDFTVQGKPAEGVLLCAWTAACGRHTD